MSVTIPIFTAPPPALGATDPPALGGTDPVGGWLAAELGLDVAPVFVQPAMISIAASTTKARVRIDSSSRSRPPPPVQGGKPVRQRGRFRPRAGRPLARIVIAADGPGK
jgi:hypothetical protein